MRKAISYFLCAFGSFVFILLMMDAFQPDRMNVSGSVLAAIIFGLFPMIVGIAFSENSFIASFWNAAIIIGGLILFAPSLLWEKAYENIASILIITFFTFFSILIIYLIQEYNKYIENEETINIKWGDVQVSYQKRIDMISSLSEAAEKYLTHEKEILIDITKARSFLSDKKKRSQKIETMDSIENSFSKLIANVEQYPELKSDRTCQYLMSEIGSNERNISECRNAFNKAVINLNEQIRSFPFIIVSKIAKLKPRDYFKADLAATSRVK